MTLHASPRAVAAISAKLKDQLANALADAAASRERQLVELPPTPGDLVAAAHRESVARILSEIRAAQARLVAGSFGDCARCAGAIPVARLELRPWTTHCVGCSHQVRP